MLCARHVRHVRMMPLNNPVCTLALQFTARSKAQFIAQFAARFVAQFDFTVVIQAPPSFAPAVGGDKSILSGEPHAANTSDNLLYNTHGS